LRAIRRELKLHIIDHAAKEWGKFRGETLRSLLIDRSKGAKLNDGAVEGVLYRLYTDEEERKSVNRLL